NKYKKYENILRKNINNLNLNGNLLNKINRKDLENWGIKDIEITVEIEEFIKKLTTNNNNINDNNENENDNNNNLMINMDTDDGFHFFSRTSSQINEDNSNDKPIIAFSFGKSNTLGNE